MVHAGSMPYSPYGAFELKAQYQRNMMISVVLAVAMGLIFGVILWVIQTPMETVIIPLQPREIDDGFPQPLPPPTLRGRPPGHRPPGTPIRGAIPNPVVDDSLTDIDTNVIISPRDYDYGDVLDSTGSSGMFIDTNIIEPLPDPEDFIPLEYQPEIVHKVSLKYPAVAKRAGMSGTVTVQVLVGKTGEPLKAIIGRSCGWRILDEAALAGALKNTYKPGIQNGVPVSCWISYRVDFSLERDT